MKRIIYISKRINGNKSTWSVPNKPIWAANWDKKKQTYNFKNIGKPKKAVLNYNRK